MFYLRILIIILVSVAMGIIYNLISLNSIPFFPDESAQLANEIKHKAENLPDSVRWKYDPTALKWYPIRADQAYFVFDKKMAKFIDPRDEWDFKEIHIKGAINIPAYKFSRSMADLKKLNKDDMIVVYCEDEYCDNGKSICDSLIDLMYKNVFLYKGGIDEWQFAQYPLEGTKVKRDAE